MADISCLNASRTPYDPTRFAQVDYNLYYDPGLALATALWIFPRFANGSWATNGSLASWRSFGGMDRHSVVADPLFVDALAGNFSLQPSSPAAGSVTVAARDAAKRALKRRRNHRPTRRVLADVAGGGARA